jgi:hypothetical protein
MFDILCARLKKAPSVQITVQDPENAATECQFRAFVMMVLGNRFRVAWSGAALPQGLKENFLQMESKTTVLVDDSEPLLSFSPQVVMAPLARQWTSANTLGFKLEFWLALDDQLEIKAVHRRKAIRFPIDVTMEVLRARVSEAPMGSRTINISAGGLRFFSTEAFAVGDLLTLKLQLIPKQPPLLLKLKVVLCMLDDSSVRGGLRFICAGKFVDLPAAYETAIMRECFRWELANATPKNQ